jgi:hypothetical protein
MAALARTMRGRPVVAAGEIVLQPSPAWSEEAARAEPNLEAQLKLITQAVGNPDEPLTAVAVGGAWALVPRYREEANPDLARLTPLQASSRSLLLTRVLMGLPPEELQAIGSAAGVPFGDLPEDVRALLAQALRPPLRIVRVVPSLHVAPGEAPRTETTETTVSDIESPIDWSRARVAANLRVEESAVDLGGCESDSTGKAWAGKLDVLRGPRLEFRLARASILTSPVNVPYLREAPNSLQPSDLDTAALTAPLGTTDVHTVAELLKRVNAKTGLHLQPGLYRFAPVFIGSASLPCRDVLDGIRLAVTATWRRLGDDYVLCWDRRGLAARQSEWMEMPAAVASAVAEMDVRMTKDLGWVRLAERLPFAADDPLAFSDAQRQRIFGSEKAENPPIVFSAMTPSQQETIRRLSENESIFVDSVGEAGPMTSARPVTAADVPSTTLSGNTRAVIRVDAPGVGWVDAAVTGLTFWYGSVDLKELRSLRKAPPQGPDPEVQKAADRVRGALSALKPAALPSSQRGIVAPVLSPERLRDLATAMKSRGLNVLFYPVLYDGAATIPTKAFPPYPGAKGQDGWASAVEAMKPAGIRIVGYLETLAWRMPGAPADHWLSAHPDWVDVDPLGRTRSQWLERNPEAGRPPLLDPFACADYVRPSEPAVAERLVQLVDDFTRQPDAAGIAFLDWRLPQPGLLGPDERPQPPPLGFTMPDRMAILLQTGVDPLDAPIVDVGVPHRFHEFSSSLPMPKPPDAHGDLLVSLLKRVKAARKGWKTYTFAQRSIEPRVDMRLYSYMSVGPSVMDGDLGVVFPIWPGNAGTLTMQMIAGMGNWFMPMEVWDIVSDQLRTLPQTALYQFAFRLPGEKPADVRLPMALYDFRAAPELLSANMEFMAPPAEGAK